MGSLAPAKALDQVRALFAKQLRYVIEHELGTGASGTVYRALDCQRSERVALKLLHRGGLHVEQVLREQLSLLEGVQHESLVEVLDHGSMDGVPYFAMRLVEGPELRKYVQVSGVGTREQRIRTALARLCGALSTLHRSKLVHRDVKPSNIRVTHDGVPVLLDYGLLAPIDKLESGAVGVGTPGYMAPEQAAGEAVGPAADMYSLGAVLYELITGRLPNDRVSRGGLPGQPLAAHLLAPDAAPDLTALAMDLLAEDPSVRPAPRQVVRRLGLALSDARAALPAVLTVPDVCVGRGRELDQIASALACCHETPSWLHIHGAAGQGKTRLLRTALRAAESASPRLLALSVSFSETTGSPYGALDQLVARLGACLGDPRAPLAWGDAAWAKLAFPSLEAVASVARVRVSASVPDPTERRLRAFRFVRDIASYVASTRPLLLVLDDLDRAPPDTLALLEPLLREPVRGALVLSSGRGPRADLGAVDVALTSLSTTDASALCEALWAHAAAEGPAPLAECAAELSPEEIIEHVRSRLLGRAASSARQAVHERVAQLTPGARTVLLSLSCALRSVTRDELLLATHIDPADLASAVEELTDAALVRARRGIDTSQALIVESELVRSEAQRGLAAEQIAAVHIDWALSYAGRSGQEELRYLHYVSAGHWDDALVPGESCALAAERMLAFVRAADLRSDMVAARPPPENESGKWALKTLGEALTRAGRPRLAADAYARAAALATSAERLDLQRRRANLLFRSADVEHGTEAVAEALASVGLSLPKSSQSALWSMLWWRTKLAFRGLSFTRRTAHQVSQLELMRIDVLVSMANVFGLVDAFRGGELLTRALALALRAGEPRHLARALIQEANGVAVMEKPPLKRTRKLLALAEELNQETKDPYSRALMQMIRGIVEFFEFRTREAIEQLDRAERLFLDECSDVAWEVGNCQQFLLQATAMLGDYRQLKARLDRYMQAANARGDQYAITNLTLLGGCFSLLVADRPDEVREALDRVIPPWQLPGAFPLQHFYQIVPRGLRSNYVCDANAFEHIEALMPALQRSMLLKAKVIERTVNMFRAQALTAAAVHAAPEQREALLKEALRVAKRMAGDDNALMQSQSHVTEASVAMLRGGRERAISELRKAFELAPQAGQSTTELEYQIAQLENDHERADGLRRQLLEKGVKDPDAFARLFGFVGVDAG